MKSLPPSWISPDSTGQVLEVSVQQNVLSRYREQGKDSRSWEVQEHAALPDPAFVHAAYRVKEHSLFFVDELHQNGRLVMSDIPQVIPPGQKKGNMFAPKWSMH